MYLVKLKLVFDLQDLKKVPISSEIMLSTAATNEDLRKGILIFKSPLPLKNVLFYQIIRFFYCIQEEQFESREGGNFLTHAPLKAIK